ncbi:hypothetical protein SAMD00023353_0700530 [Rosellinia necatrix]|uniref:Uncharacterized protein n=1 Tax=Rosellinia necatrix TaxID=77044 RepID=A0A1S8A5T0_ROSNE|nr:hypothetical protein SAMD00023353_0700530 [Rosellinia necatrix]
MPARETQKSNTLDVLPSSAYPDVSSLGPGGEMYIQPSESSSRELSSITWGVSHVKRSPQAVYDSGKVIAIIIGIIFVSVFFPLYWMMHRTWRQEREDALKKREANSQEGVSLKFGKPELPSDPQTMRQEMDSQRVAQELSETKDALPHELLGEIAMPQELPAALHEMPAGDDDMGGKENRMIKPLPTTEDMLCGIGKNT